MRNNIYAFLKSISETNGRFGDGVQEDTFEFYNILLSTLQDEALENIRRPLQDDTYDEHIMRHCGASRLFGGKFLMTYCYEACGHVDTVFQPFTSLSIPVTKNPDGLSNSAVTLTVNDSDGNSAYYVSSGIGGKYGSLSDQNQLLKEKMDVDSTNRIEVKSSNISKPPESKLFSGLSLAKGNMDVIQTGVEWGLEKLTETETMEASEVSCRICKDGNVGVLYKKLQVISLPPVLVLQINRFNQVLFYML
ncbi:uncharacterized protein LOC110444644 [Mizuhopecten yessoensis]|uniref:uncharacterized protein LOC110444644 n=1 Tax=Mizuhopecten yessoensis TaxID=6573 RepID=UPI000B45B5AA|nr:uncharacterized protein LOC110444644 [Mizuhopecten yessoensis]